MPTLISAQNLTKYYGTRRNPIRALGPVNFEIPKGSFTVILGRSGSGKSTLLNLLAGLDKATSGTLLVDNQDLSTLNQKKLAKYRSQIGIIFQFYNLLPNLNALENIMMGAWAGGNTVTQTAAEALMTKFGLSHRTKADVKTLSGGEKQRVAICRSLISDPDILFCDEPTGALDSANETQVEEILKQLHAQGLTIVMVTHNPEFSAFASQIIHMQDGLIQTIETK
jgi:putative ABC transport system ATP-binding protein